MNPVLVLRDQNQFYFYTLESNETLTSGLVELVLSRVEIM